MDAMDYWQTLVGNALMGTERQPPQPPTVGEHTDDGLIQVLHQLDWRQPERSMLAAAGVIALYQQAGQRPVAGETVTKETLTGAALGPCAAETLAYCSQRTVRYLNTVLTDYPAILPEVLKLLAAAQQCVPPELLPKLLTVGQNWAYLRPQIVAVIGKRGQWLGRQNIAWSYGVVEGAEFKADARVWREGRRSDRALFLRQWRDRDGDGARAALAAAWSAELAKDRAALMASLANNLSMADEPFLEKALGDRTQAVRHQALELLVQLPDSRLCQRVAAHIGPFVSVIHAKKLAVTVDVVLPKAFDPAWEPDGILPQQVAGLGKKASWLYQMLASISLDHWPGEADAIVQAIDQHRWREMLLKGWSVAALRQRNRAWAKVLVHQCDFQDVQERLLPDLLGLLPLADQEAFLRDRMPSGLKDLLGWLQQVDRCAQPWGAEFSGLVIQQLFALIRSCDRTDHQVHYPIKQLLKNLAIVLQADLAPMVAKKIYQLPDKLSQSGWIQPSLDEFHQLITLRYEIHQVINPSG